MKISDNIQVIIALWTIIISSLAAFYLIDLKEFSVTLTAIAIVASGVSAWSSLAASRLLRSRRPLVYVSMPSSDYDGSTADNLVESLKEAGIRIIKPNETIMIGSSIDDSVSESIGSADGVLMICYRHLSIPQTRELEIANRIGVKVFPVFVDDVVEDLPEEFEGIRLGYINGTKEFDEQVNLLERSIIHHKRNM